MATEAVNIICRNNSCGSTHFSKVQWCPYCGTFQPERPAEISVVALPVESDSPVVASEVFPHSESVIVDEVSSELEELPSADTPDLITEQSVPPPVRKVDFSPVVKPSTEPQNPPRKKFNFQRLAVTVVLAAIGIWGAGSLLLTGADGENAEQDMAGLDQGPVSEPISAVGTLANNAGAVSKPEAINPAQNPLIKPEIKIKPEQQQPTSEAARKFEIDKRADSNELNSPVNIEEPRKPKPQVADVEKLLVDAELWITQENAQSQANAINNVNAVLSSKHDGVRTLQQTRRAEFIKEKWKAIRKSVSDDTVQ